MTLIAMLIILILLASLVAYLLIRKFGNKVGSKIEREINYFETGGCESELLRGTRKTAKRNAPKSARKEDGNE